MKISIIIPVFNSADYLKRCLDSITKQTFNLDDVEVIIINDGSTDKSEEIIKQYKLKLNLHYLKQKNHGQSYSRNKGLKIAKGEYITFIDSDDFLASTMLEKLYKKIIQNDYDIVTCALAKVKGEKIKPLIECLSQDEIRNFILTKVGPCNMLIKKAFLRQNNFSFPLLHKYEDIAVIPLLGLKTDVKIKALPEVLYYYYDNSNSVMNSSKYTKDFDDIFTSMSLLLKNAQKEVTYEKYIDEIEYLFIRHLLMSAGLRYARFNDPDNKIPVINSFMKEHFPNWKKNRYFKKSSIKYKLTAFLINKKRTKMIKIIDLMRGKK